MHNFTIRPAGLSDIPHILALTVNGIGIWGSHINSNLKPWLDEICCSSYIEKKILNPRHHIFMAEKDDVVVGTVYLNTENQQVAHMGGLYCALRKSGLGTTLLQYVMEEACHRGYGAMECAIYENNVPSISLMKKYGAFHTDTETYDGINYLTYRFDLEYSLLSV